MMSDIGFHGLVAALVGAAMIALATLGLLVEGVLAMRRRGSAGGRPGTLAFLAPAAYGGVGGIILAAAEYTSLGTQARLDNVAPFVAVAGVLLWGVLRTALARRHPAAA